MKTYKIKVTGRVQGVGFRYYTSLEAITLDLIGSVKNLADGSVEVIAQGAEDQMDAFLKWLHQGPSTALVERLDYQEIDPIKGVAFEILR